MRKLWTKFENWTQAYIFALFLGGEGWNGLQGWSWNGLQGWKGLQELKS